MYKQKIVIALGGNALGNSPKEQKEIVKKTAYAIVKLAGENNEVVICHGNGPQVGMINLGFDEANKSTNGKIPTLPLPEAGSMSQGYIGFHLQNAIYNELKKQGINREVVTIISQTEVDLNDPAFSNPTKPIGSFYSKEKALKLAKEKKWIVKEDSGRGWRRYVASPFPKDIVEKNIIKDLLEKQRIVIASGGGGIPVVREGNNLNSIPAVIDKDRVAAKISTIINANKFIILTAVENVAINFGKSNEKKLERVSIEEMEKHMKDKQFAEGSMKPKVEAAIDFVKKNANCETIITSLKNIEKIFDGKHGTIICKNC